MSDPKYFQEGFKPQLSHLIEECGELLQAAGKLQRWGIYSTNPEVNEGNSETNLQWLMREIADVKEAIKRIEETVADGNLQDYFQGE